MAGKRLLILGGGFGGLDVARAIGRSAAARGYWDTRLIDKENFFQFNPLLPAVAVGAVETRHIVYPHRAMARHRNILFHKNKAVAIDLEHKRVHLHNELVAPYDTLVIAIGSTTNYYGVPGAEEHTRPFKTIADAMMLRARVVELFEMAEQAETDAQRKRLLSFAVVGGGVTGVEVAAELLDMMRETLLPRFARIHPSDISLTIIDGGERLAAAARPEHSAYIERFLVRRGVRVLRRVRVTRVEEKRVWLGDGSCVEAFTILWTAGIRAPQLLDPLPLLKGSSGRIRVDDQLRALDPAGQPVADVYVIGDAAACLRADGEPHPALSQTAVAMGTQLGAALVAEASGRSTKPFRFRETGYIISLGKHSSVVNLFGIPCSGSLGWLLWATAYLIKMVGLRKQIEVGIDQVTHRFFEHDVSQIMARRQILSDRELNLSLGALPADPPPRAPEVVAARSGSS